MNFTTLRYFLVAAEEGNITRAAGRLYISQQALSGHIAKLEKEHPDHFAVKQYRKFKLAAGDICSK